MRAIHAWLTASPWRRAGGAGLALWIGLILAIATYKAIDRGHDIDSLRMVFLLCVGAPVAIAALTYSAFLGGKRVVAGVAALAIVYFLLASWNQQRKIEDQRRYMASYREAQTLANAQWDQMLVRFDSRCDARAARVGNERARELASRTCADMAATVALSRMGLPRPQGAIPPGALIVDPRYGLENWERKLAEDWGREFGRAEPLQ